MDGFWWCCGNGNTTEGPDLETKAVLQRTGLGPRVPRPLPKSNKPQPAQIFFFFCVFFLLPAEEGSIRATHTNSL